MKPQRTKILIVDDIKSNQLILGGVLRKEGYSILYADNGPSARKLAVSEHPSLIVLDIHMPGEDGFEVIEWLKANVNTRNIPVIFISAADNVDQKVEAFNLGAVDYIVKPFSSEEVKARIRTHLRLSQATQDLIEAQTHKLQQLRHAQTSMLTTPKDVSGGNFSVYYEAIEEAGGDFYDVLALSEHVHGYFVSDISGHDIETSYLTSALKALLRQNCNISTYPVEAMYIINSVLTEILPPGKYITANYLQLNRLKNEIICVGMGHPPCLHIPANSTSRFIETQGDVLGIFEEVTFETKRFKVAPKDKLILFSDGLIENPNNAKLWTSQLSELKDIGDKVGHTPIQETAQTIVNLTRKSVQSSTIDDDVVVLAIEV